MSYQQVIHKASSFGVTDPAIQSFVENGMKAFNPSQYRFCLDEQILTPDQSYVSQNQKLVGRPNPKTLKPTVIIAPPTATDFWSDNHVIPHAINASTNQDVSQSGYLPSTSFYWDRPSNLNTCCASVESGSEVIENVQQTHKQIDGYNGSHPNGTHPPQIEGYHSSHKMPQSHHISRAPCAQYEEYKSPEADKWRKDMCDSSPMACKGDPVLYDLNSRANIPINRMVGDCHRSEDMSRYNKELYTSTIEPGIYTRSSVVEPTQYNIGISHTEEFEPLAVTKEKEGLIFTQLPHSAKVPASHQSSEDYPNNSNIYDPRLTGYGTSYRSYNNKLLGQPDFFYDDIDSVRRPNYIVRSNIDHATWANQYGPMDPRKGGCIEYAAAQNQFLSDTGSQRTELQERLMRKYNTQIGWQRRLAPLRRDTAANFTYR
jgi:hypothetical protein